MWTLKNYTAEELHRVWHDDGVSLRTARRLQAAVLRTDAWPQHLPEVSDALLARMSTVCTLPRLRVVDRHLSPADGFAKYLFEGDAPGRFEGVGIPLIHGKGEPKTVACVSSQAGCAMGCAFCATGRLGLIRQLETWELVDQVLRIRTASPHPVRGVVFMGMGEPMENLDAVLHAIRILSEPCGLALAAKAITLSTSGVVPGILRLADERCPCKLIVSLTSADSEKRARWMPVERRYPLPELRRALGRYHNATGRRITLAWTMISGVNTGESDALQLARWLDGLPATLDLLDVNDATGRLSPPSEEERNAFLDALRRHTGIPVQRRYSGGRDIHAACGMLAASAVEKGDAIPSPATAHFPGEDAGLRNGR